MRESNQAKLYSGAFILFVLLYVCGIIYNSSMPFMSGDDIAFYTALVRGEEVWHGLNFELGRFFPLAGWNLNLVALFSTNPYAFMVANACVFVITAWAFWRIGMILGIAARWICVAFVAFCLSAGYTHIVTSLCYPELTEIMFLLLFILMAHRFYTSGQFFYFVLALVFGNACIYLKEVAFIFVGGLGFLHLVFILWNKRGFGILNRKIVIFDLLCMMSAVVFLGLYVYFAFEAKGSYKDIIPLFSIFNTLLISFLAVPIISMILPLLLLFRAYRILKYKEKIAPLEDAIGVLALAYFGAYIALGMAAFHYFSPSNILAFLYALFCARLYAAEFRCIFARVVLWVSVGILLTSAIPQGLNAFSTYKTQSKNTQDAFEFLASYIRTSPTQVNVYFDGFCRGVDKCLNALFYYPALFQTLPDYFHITSNYDIKSKEPNGGHFTINPSSPLTFFNSDEVSTPQSGDVIILHYASSKYMSPSDVEKIVGQYEILFVSNNYPYYPTYNLMSLGAWVLKQLGISTFFDNRGNIFKLPAQVYILRVP